MTGDLGRLSAATALLIACTGAHAAPPAPERLTVVHRLADERAEGEKLADAPTATVGDVTRYVLVTPVTVTVPLPQVPQVGSDGTLVLDLPCPDILAGREGLLSVRLLGVGVTHTQRVTCPAAEGRLEVRVPGLARGRQVVPVVTALRLPERVDTAPLSVPAGARLRVALGVSGSPAGTESAPVRFVVTAESPGKAGPMTVLERTLDAGRTAADRNWVENDVPLDAARAALGASFRLVFQTEMQGPAGFPVWGDPLVVTAAPARDKQPWNVILVSVDTLRADRLGCYGQRRPTSPALDRLAHQGAVFSAAVAQAPWTLPSHVSLMTGLYACAHEVVTGGSGHRLTPGARPLAAVLRTRGYATAAFTEGGFLEVGVFQPGFGVYRANEAMNPSNVEATVGAARAWLEANRRLPFLLFVHTYQVHAPYRVPASCRQRFTTYEGPDGPHPLAEAPGNLQELATYDTAIRYTDDVLATLFAAVHDLGLDDHTIVVVTSDHGEAFWEHGISGHGKTLYEEEIHVPLIWRAPGLIAADRRVPGVVGLIDVLPTLTDFLGITPPETVQGRSLAPLLRAKAPANALPADRVVFTETSLEGYHRAARAAGWKALLANDGTPQVFDLGRDPEERQAADASPYADAARRAQADFESECTRTKARLASLAPPPEAIAPAPQPSPEREQHLRALGYVQ